MPQFFLFVFFEQISDSLSFSFFNEMKLIIQEKATSQKMGSYVFRPIVWY